MPKNVLKEGVIDVIIRGEGEETFLELIKRIESDQPWDNIEGISYMNGDKQFISNNGRMRIKDINSLPYPDWGQLVY